MSEAMSWKQVLSEAPTIHVKEKSIVSSPDQLGYLTLIGLGGLGLVAFSVAKGVLARLTEEQAQALPPVLLKTVDLDLAA